MRENYNKPVGDVLASCDAKRY